MTAAGLQWLTARPVAHRGLHEESGGRVENSLSAALAAIHFGYAIELDVQISRDGEAMVIHDFSLERLTGEQGRIDARDARRLSQLVLKGGQDHIPALPDFLATIAGRTPVFCEIKSRFDGDMRLAERTADIAAAYEGPIALNSFDPRVIAHLRAKRDRPGIQTLPLGMVAQADYAAPEAEWAHLSAPGKAQLAQFLHWPETRPDFLSWNVRDLPHATPFLCRQALGMPVLAWTVRTPDDQKTQRLWADQMVFEGIRP